LESSPIYVCENDKFSIHVDFRHDGQVETVGSPGNYNVMQLRLYADNGDHWIYNPVGLTNDTSSWLLSDASWATNNNFFNRESYLGTDDDTDWMSVGNDFEDVAKAPATGYLTILLVQVKKPNEFETHFQNLRFEYIPLINGSFKPYKGEQYKFYTEEGLSAKRESDSFLFDACKGFTGAMMYEDSGDFFSTSNWTDFNIYVQHNDEMLPEAALGEVQFLHWQAYSLWNQFRRSRRIFEFQFYNLDTANGHAGVHHRYTYNAAQLGVIQDMSFIILSMRQDWHSCQWSAKMIEINYDQDRRDPDSSIEFKYLE
jgi:hypothetical protein